jgi:hypothetical protein
MTIRQSNAFFISFILELGFSIKIIISSQTTKDQFDNFFKIIVPFLLLEKFLGIFGRKIAFRGFQIVKRIFK